MCGALHLLLPVLGCGGVAPGLLPLLAEQILDTFPSGHPQKLLYHAHRAPQLLAAVLGRGGVAPGLLPLLAEPASAALRGLSVMARRARAAAAAPFLQASTLKCVSCCSMSGFRTF